MYAGYAGLLVFVVTLFVMVVSGGEANAVFYILTRLYGIS